MNMDVKRDGQKRQQGTWILLPTETQQMEKWKPFNKLLPTLEAFKITEFCTP
jgi:hypothetical protein